MARGQIAIVAGFSVLVLLLGIFLLWPVVRPIFLGLQGDDNLVNFFLDTMGFLVVLAAFIAFFVFKNSGVAQ